MTFPPSGTTVLSGNMIVVSEMFWSMLRGKVGHERKDSEMHASRKGKWELRSMFRVKGAA